VTARERGRLGRDAVGARTQADGTGSGNDRLFELGGQVLEAFGRKGLEQGFQDDFGLAEAGVEVVVERIEQGPGVLRLGGDALGDVGGGIMKFGFNVVHGGGEDAEFVEETGALGKENVVEDAVPGSGALARVAAEEFGAERLDMGNIGDVLAGAQKGVAGGAELAGRAREKFGGDANLLTSANELAAGTESEGVLQGDAHHGVFAFPTGYDGSENAVLITGQ
jgi:hypothetical protein